MDQNESASMEQVLAALDAGSEFARGSIIEATVIDADDRDVYLDIGLKQDGRCPRDEFGEVPPVGTRIPVVVVQGSDDGLVRLSRKEADLRLCWDQLKEAYEAKAQLSGAILRSVNHGYIVDYGGLQLFLPASQADGRRAKLAIGATVDFKILELKERHRSAVVSHRAVIEERNDAFWAELLSKHNVGDVVEGKVTKKVSFGLFVSVLGVEGLLHQSDISWKKHAPFKDRFKIGDTATVKILAMDKDNNRLSLGVKQLGEDPWDWAARSVVAGHTIHGKVTNVTDYGAFVEIVEGLEGLIHVSELSWAKRVLHPKKYLQTGQEIDAMVLGIDLEQKRISLGLRQLQKDPWSDIHNIVKRGDIREGEVTSIAKFGAFVKITDEIEGLVHFKDYSWDDEPDRKLLKKGDNVKFKVLDVNTSDRRISCGIKQLTPSPFEELRKKYRKGDVLECTVRRIAPFGLFVDIGAGFEGLIHVSNLMLNPDQKMESVYKEGDVVKAALLGIDTDEKKISLSIKAYQRKNERDLIDQYVKKDGPSTSSLGSFLKKSDS
ncbi:MAG: 30S ribosomal protein S1 [Spirochaetia bacterium]|nr:30S ribosomal protein S1 [Spirochaetia bacterium]